MPRTCVARIGAWLAAMACALPAGAGFSVSPMRLELGAGARSAALSIRNEGAVASSFSIRAVAWRQDEAGEDIYEDTSELIYFPRLLTLDPGQDAAVRLGPRKAPAEGTGAERAYRVFVEELPPTGSASPAQGAVVRVTVRFGVPVFAAWDAPARQLVVDALALQGGEVHWLLRNEGNRHELFESVRVSGRDRQGQALFTEALPARYLLAGAQRRFRFALPPGVCAQIAQIELQVKTAQTDVHRQLAIEPAACP